MAATFKLEGGDEFRQALTEVDSEIRKAVERAVGEEVEDLADDMKRNAAVGDASRGPRGEPPLAESIVQTHDGPTGTVGPRAPHAVHVEHGTSSHPADSFAQPAAERSRRRFPGRVGDEVRKAVE